MTNDFTGPTGRPFARVRKLFAARDFIFHDGRGVRRLRVGARAQVTAALAVTGMTALAGYGFVGVASATAVATGIVAPPASTQRIAAMEGKLAAMQDRVHTIGQVAKVHAKRIEERQALLDAALTGSDAADVRLSALSVNPAADRLAAHTLAPMLKVEDRQAALATTARRALEQRYALTASHVSKLGIAPARLARNGGMGGPLIAATSAEARADLGADAQFRSLFMTWKKLDTLEQGVIAIPSVQPVDKLKFTSNFGIRSDPFRGTAAFHAGVDIPGPIGTEIHATADGIVGRAERAGGYGNLVELEHGKGIATRYGHLSKILVQPGQRVKRGQLIALMGSTGRSTGSHLHYEVRIDGHAVNPAPFLTTADYLMAAQDRAVHDIPVATGPAPQD